MARSDFKSTAIGSAPAATTTDSDTKKTTMNAPATLFHVPSLQNMIGEQLLSSKFTGNLSKFIEYIKTDPQLPDPLRHSMMDVYHPRLMQMMWDLLQSVIDDNSEKVKAILDLSPELLLLDPASLGVTEIESQLTWQKFLTEKPFIMVQKLKRLEMTRTMLPYFEKLVPIKDMKAVDAKDEKSEAEKQWVIPKLLDSKVEEQQNNKLQEKYIEDYFNALIATIISDNRVTVDSVRNSETQLSEASIKNLDEKTNQALQNFRDILLPNRAIAIDKYFDIEQLLIAAYKVYEKRFGDFKNWHQRDLFAVCVVSFILSVAPPPLAKVYCESLVDVVDSNKPLGEKALAFKLQDGRSFYRSSRDSHSGAGFTFLCGIYASADAPLGCRCRFLLENYVKQERQNLANLRNEFGSSQNRRHRL